VSKALPGFSRNGLGAGELVPVETVRPGDEIEVGRLGFHVVSDVDAWERWGDGVKLVAITYFKRGQAAFEYRARRRGPSYQLVWHEISLVAKPPGELVTVIRGRPQRAEQLRREMEAEQQARFDRLEERLAQERPAA